MFATKQRAAITLSCTRTVTVSESISGSAGLRKIYRGTCAVHCSPWSKTHAVTVQRHLGNTFRYFGTGAE